LRSATDVSSPVTRFSIPMRISVRYGGRVVAILPNGSRLVYPSDRGITVRSRDRLAGGLRFLAATATDRVLLIEIAFGLDRYARIAMLGHELQQAVEVAETAQIRDQEGFRRFYASHSVVGAI
jgi:hypothetical protein